MITYTNISPIIEALDSQSKTVGTQMFQSISLTGSDVHCSNGFDCLSSPNTLIYIKRGIFKYFHEKKMIRLYGSGDSLILFHPQPQNCRCVSEFGADIQLFTRKEIVDAAHESTEFCELFLEFVSLQSQLMHLLCASYVNDEAQQDFNLQSFETGTIIIAEGAPAHEIYMLVQGTAVVTVKGVEVGAVAPGEVFGEISFFTSGIRTATVTATTECLVQVMSKENFVSLLKIRPSVNIGISKVLSERLVEANRKLSEK